MGAMVESAPTASRRLSPNRANPIAPASRAKKPIRGGSPARRAVAICEGMAIAASVKPATTSAPRSLGRQPAKDRKIGQGWCPLGAEFSFAGCVTLCAPSCAEPLSIILRTHALESEKTSPHRLLRPKSAARCNSLNGQAGVGEQLTRRLDAQPLDRARGRQARRLPIAAQEGPLDRKSVV